MTRIARYFPPLDWGRSYGRATLTNDLVAAVIVTIMLIPQSLAYALLAGLPAQAGIYASIVPIILYSLFGTSRLGVLGEADAQRAGIYQASPITTRDSGHGRQTHHPFSAMMGPRENGKA